MSLDEFLVDHPVDRRRVETRKAQMRAQIRAYRLRELRQQAGLTQGAEIGRASCRERV